MSLFGRLVAASDVEEQVLDLLQLWLPSYLAEVERYHELEQGSLPEPRSWEISSAVERFPEDQLPAVMLASPGLSDPPLAEGQGVYTARWQMVIASQTAARGNRYALRLARLYALAIRGVLIQQQKLGDLSVRRIDWMDERYRLLDTVDDRSTCVSEVEVAIEVMDVLTRNAGPVELPPPGPDSPVWPDAQTADVGVVKVPIEEEL